VEELGLTGSSQARVEAAQAKELETGLTEQDKRANVVRLAFQGDEERLKEFVEIIRSAIPPDTGVVLRGSAVTGRRWKDGALFDCEGPGTSDLDLTLVGDEVIGLYKVTGFFLPGIHSRPISKDDPDIAPALVPLRERLMDMVRRPVNIQATRDFVMYVRGELLGQPYLVLIEKPTEAERA
jgi:predicted nucleotidyltransferase